MYVNKVIESIEEFVVYNVNDTKFYLNNYDDHFIVKMSITLYTCISIYKLLNFRTFQGSFVLIN